MLLRLLFRNFEQTEKDYQIINPLSGDVYNYTTITYTKHCQVYRGLMNGEISVCKPKTVKIKEPANFTTEIDFEAYVKRCISFLSKYCKITKDESEEFQFLSGEFQYPSIGVSENYEVSLFARKFRMNNTVVITNFDIDKYLRSLQKVDLPSKLDIPSIPNPNNRILICSLDLGSIFNVRYTDTENIEEAKKELLESDKDVRNIFFAFGDQLKSTNISFVSCVAAPNIATNCESDNDLIFTDDSFSSEFGVQSKLKDLVDDNKTVQEGSKHKMTRVISIIIGCLVSEYLSLVLSYKEGPRKFVWLTYQQSEVVHSEYFWKIIQGGYGSGKTIVAMSLVKEIRRTITIASDIYFLILAENSILRKDIEGFWNNIESECEQSSTAPVKFICTTLNEFAESFSKDLRKSCHPVSAPGDINLSISNILKTLIDKYRDATDKRFHLFIDELDCELLSENEAKEIENMLTDKNNEKHLEQSHIVFVTRPMEKDRTFVSQNDEVSFKAFEKYKLIKQMHIFPLDVSMRTSENVYKVIQVAIEAIREPNKIIQEAVDNDNKGENMEKKHLDSVGTEKKNRNFGEQSNIRNNNDDIGSLDKTLQEAVENADKCENMEKQHLDSVGISTDTEKKNRDFGEESNIRNNDDDIDSVSKKMEEQHQGPEGDSNIVINDLDNIDFFGEKMENQHLGLKSYVKTMFRFTGYKMCGFDIPQGKKTKLIFLNAEDDNLLTKNNVANLSIVLEEHCSKDIKRRLIICNNTMECKLFMNALDVLRWRRRVYLPIQNIDTKMFENGTAGNSNLITDCNGCRGQEYREVVVVLDPQEHHKRQYVIESMSRCFGNLILIVPYPYKSDVEYKYSSVKDIIVKLVNRVDLNLIDVFSYTVNESFTADLTYPNVCDDSQININTIHNKYNKLYLPNELKDLEWKHVSPNFKVPLSIGKPNAVTGFRCNLLSFTKVKLSWYQTSSRFVIHKTDITDNKEEEEVFNILNAAKCEIAVHQNRIYKFEIKAMSSIGELHSEPIVIQYPNRLDQETNLPNEGNLDQLMASYLIDHSLHMHRTEGKYFCENLLNDIDKVEEIFSYNKYDRPVLSAISYFFANGLHQEKDPLQLIAEILDACDLAGHKLQQDELNQHPFLLKEKMEENILEEISSRQEVFRTISKQAGSKATLIAHFLLKYHKVQQIFIDNPGSVEERLFNVLNCWYDDNPDNQTTWMDLKSLLLFLNRNALVKKLEQDENNLFVLYRDALNDWKNLLTSRFTATVLTKTPSEYSLIHGFIECMKDNKELRKEIVLKDLKNEIKEYESWYSDVFGGDVKNVKQYLDTGVCDKTIAFLVAAALVNAYKVNIMILKQDNNGLFFIEKESDLISPKRAEENKYVTIQMTVNDDGYFQPLEDVEVRKSTHELVTKKRSVKIFRIKERNCIIEVNLLSTDQINNLQLFNGSERIRIDLDTLDKDNYLGSIYILLKYLDEDVIYRCYVGIADEFGNVQDVTSKDFSLSEKSTHMRHFNKDYTTLVHGTIQTYQSVGRHTFKEEILTSTSKENINKWIERCIKYLETNFVERTSSYFHQWVLYPTAFMDFTSCTKRIAQLFKTTFRLTQHQFGGFIITNYNSCKHAKFFRQDESISKHRDFENRILIFSAEHNAVINIRVTESESLKDISMEIDHCMEDTKDITALIDFLIHKKMFMDPQIVIVSFVAATNLTCSCLKKIILHGEKYCCENCIPFVLTNEQLINAESLKLWLQIHLAFLIKKESHVIIDETSCHKNFKLIISQIVGFMSCTSIKVPSFYNSTHHVQVNEEQLTAVISPIRHMLIRGGYGVGKSIVAMLRLEFLARMAMEKTKLFFISFDPYSLLDCFITNHMLSLKLDNLQSGLVKLEVPNLESIGRKMGVGRPTVSQILQYVKNVEKEEDVRCHVVIDDINSEFICTKEAQSINKELINFKENDVLLIVQPFERHRSSVIKRNIFQSKKVTESDSHKYNEINALIILLTKVMIYSSNMYNLIQSAQTVISGQPSHIDTKAAYDHTITKLKFTPSKGIGHSHVGSLPQLLYLPATKSVNELNKYDANQSKILQLSFCLHSVDVRQGDVIIVNDADQLTFMKNALKMLNKEDSCTSYAPYLLKFIPELSLKEKILENLKRSIVITDSKGFRGMHLQRVIILLQLDERYEGHVIIDNISKTTSDLILFVEDDVKSIKHKYPLTRDVIKTWKKDNLIDIQNPAVDENLLSQWSIKLPNSQSIATDLLQLQRHK